jgi:hypothetical protein
MVYLVFLIALSLSNCFASDFNQDAYEYLSKHPRTTQFYPYKELEDGVSSSQSSRFPHKIVGADNQYDVLYIGPQAPESLFSKITRFIRGS